MSNFILKRRNRGDQPSSSASSHAAFGSRQSSLSGSGLGKRKTRPKGGSVQQKKLVTRCFHCNRFGHWSGDPICPAEDKNDAQAHVTSCTLQETVHVHPESFVTRSISVEQELRGAGACDTCCDRTVASQEWMNDYVHSLKKAEIEVLDAALSRTFSSLEQVTPLFARQPTSFQLDTWSLCNHACFRGARTTDAVDW